MKRLLKPRNLIWLVAIPVIVIAIRIFPWPEIFAALKTLTAPEITILLLLNGLILLAFSSRWWFILRALGYKLPYIKLAGIRLAGFAISYFTPGTQFGGEPLQAYLVQTQLGLPASTAIASITLDKIFEIMANFVFVATGVILAINTGMIPGLASSNSVIWISLLPAMPILYLVILRFRRYPLTGLVHSIPKKIAERSIVQKVSAMISSSEIQMADFMRQKPFMILWILILSGLVWVLMILEYWLMARYLGAQLSLLQAVAGLTAIRLAFMTPLPGGVGVLEAGQVLAMEAFGYTSAFGITISLLIRARDLLVGLGSLWLGAFLASRGASSPDWRKLPAESQAALTGD